MSERVLLWTDEAMIDHRPAHSAKIAHPERPERLEILLDLLDEPGLAGALDRRQPSPASAAALERVHTQAHVQHLLGLHDQTRSLDPDTSISAGSVHAARLAAGAVLDAVAAVCTTGAGASRRAMCLVRPPGHHAEPHRAMGFCLFDNIAVAAEAALAAGWAERVLIVDWDVHHGNGTQAAFYERDDVLVFDLHQYPWFPGSGELNERGRGAGAGYTLNCPLPAGMGDADYLALCDRLLPPVAQWFAPDLVLVSAGFDAHADDPLGGMELSAAGFAQLCARVQAVADRHAGGRMVASLEGGYQLAALRDSVRACVEVMAGGEPAAVGHAGPASATGPIVEHLAQVLAPDVDGQR